MKQTSFWFVFARDIHAPLSATRCGNWTVLFNAYNEDAINGFRTCQEAQDSIADTLKYGEERGCDWTREDYQIIEVRV
jgi:hypothetical protein